MSGPSFAPPAVNTPAPALAAGHRRRAYWLKTLHEWHWVSSALCLIGLLLFGITGFTLNHSAQIEAKPVVTHQQGTLDAAVLARLAAQLPAIKQHSKGKAPLPGDLQAWIQAQWDVATAGKPAEWSDDEIYLSLPRPGGDAWLRLSLADGAIEYERTERGWLAYLNDLHKGRNTGTAWSWFIDIFAASTLVFSLTGLFILKMHAGNRPFTWPMVGIGLVIPVLLALLFIHGRPGFIDSKERPLVQVRYSTATTATVPGAYKLLTLSALSTLAGLSALLSAPAFAAGLNASIEVPRLKVSEYHRPYVAAWIERADNSMAATVAVWYDVRVKANSPEGEGTKYLKDLRQWWRRGGRELTLPIDGVSGATKPAGKQLLSVSEGSAAFPTLAPGAYKFVVEAAREDGGREVVSLPFQWPPTGTEQSAALTATGSRELGEIKLSFKP